MHNWYKIASKSKFKKLNINKKLICSYNDYKVYLISGQELRDKIDVEFYAGGNSCAYSTFIPDKEFWIQDIEIQKGQPQKQDIQAILLHELIEYFKMKEGWNYQKAHNFANKNEDIFRKTKQIPQKAFSQNKNYLIAKNLLQEFIKNI